MPLNRRSFMAAAAFAGAGFSPALGQDATQDAFVGPLAGWKDVQRDFGAKGDGRSDDTAALQRALDALVDGSGACTLYLPRGVYRISQTLTLPRRAATQAIGLNIQGEDPATVTLLWDGPSGGAMLHSDAWYSKLGRISFDGAGRAGVGLKCGPSFITGNEAADLHFKDMAVGVETGDMAESGTAETAFLRCRFHRCARAGFSCLNFNALDLWFWRCLFEDCAIGLTNALQGAGNFHAYGCLFRRSRMADITIRNTGYFSFRDNVSIGSKAFFVASFVEAAACITLQRNRVIDPLDMTPIRIGNLGPVLSFDNLVISRPRSPGPAISAPNAELVSVGDRFTVDDPIGAKPGFILVDLRKTTPSAADRAAPSLPAAPGRYGGKVVELPATASAAAIQAAINGLGLGGGVVHLAVGEYAIDRTLNLPANREVRLIGEGLNGRTMLRWTGAAGGPLLRLVGPSRARVQDIDLTADHASDAVLIDGADLASLALDQVFVTDSADQGFRFERLARTVPRLSNIGHSGCGVGVSVSAAHVELLCGASSNNQLSYAVEAGGRLVARDIWYETGTLTQFVHLDGQGDFTLNGSNIALVRKSGQPSVALDGFQGRVAFLGVIFTAVGDDAAPQVAVERADARSELLLLGCHGSGEYLATRDTRGRAVRAQSTQYTPGGGAKPIGDVGQLDPDWLRRMLAPIRAGAPSAAPDAARLTRVLVRASRVGVLVRG